MKTVLQRVTSARVTTTGHELGTIKKGLVVFLGVSQNDTDADLQWTLKKILDLRIFSDDKDKMNLSVMDVHGGLLIISQFTLLADINKGRRPSFFYAANPGRGREYYERFIQLARGAGITVATGEFGADMQVELVNDGPVTIVLDSEKQ